MNQAPDTGRDIPMGGYLLIIDIPAGTPGRIRLSLIAILLRQALACLFVNRVMSAHRGVILPPPDRKPAQPEVSGSC